MKLATIAGNIGKSAEMRHLRNGDAVCNFSVAVSEGRDKPTTWFDVSLYGKRGESLCQYLTKGSKVTVSGTLTTREHEGKTYLGVRCNEIALQGKPSGSNDERAPRQDYSDQDFDDAPF